MGRRMLGFKIQDDFDQFYSGAVKIYPRYVSFSMRYAADFEGINGIIVYFD